jgi:2-polyprenyl-6-hydroxyphenyl methylase/3-demethylubiquinone-9 3-methyltransferase
MEMLEHVPDPASVISACYSLVKPGGSVYFSTINRNPKSYLLAIVGAEYMMKMLPRGTHDYARFIKPSELDSWARAAGLELSDLKGVSYNPFTGLFSQSQDVDVNYMVHYTKPLTS